MRFLSVTLLSVSSVKSLGIQPCLLGMVHPLNGFGCLAEAERSRTGIA